MCNHNLPSLTYSRTNSWFELVLDWVGRKKRVNSNQEMWSVGPRKGVSFFNKDIIYPLFL